MTVSFAKMDKNTVITLVAGYIVCCVWPHATPKVNDFLKDNLGNETVYQMPEKMDEVWYIGLYKFFMKMPWVFQLYDYSHLLATINRHFTMHFTSLKNLIEFIVFLLPNIVQGVVWVINIIVKFAEMAARLLVCFFVWVFNTIVKFVNIIVRLFVCIFHFASPRRRMRARGFSPGARGASPNEVDNPNQGNRRRMRARDASPGARGFSPGARGASPGARGASSVPELRRSIRQGVHVPSTFRT